MEIGERRRLRQVDAGLPGHAVALPQPGFVRRLSSLALKVSAHPWAGPSAPSPNPLSSCRARGGAEKERDRQPDVDREPERDKTRRLEPRRTLHIEQRHALVNYVNSMTPVMIVRSAVSWTA